MLNLQNSTLVIQLKHNINKTQSFLSTQVLKMTKPKYQKSILIADGRDTMLVSILVFLQAEFSEDSPECFLDGLYLSQMKEKRELGYNKVFTEDVILAITINLFEAGGDVWTCGI